LVARTQFSVCGGEKGWEFLWLCPRNDVSGGRVLKKKTRKAKSRLATALRLAATAFRGSDSYLGARFRRLRSRLGPPKAITAMAAKQASLVYRMLKYGQEYVDQGAAMYEEKYREQQIDFLQKKPAQKGLALVPVPTPAYGNPLEIRTCKGVSGESRRGRPRAPDTRIPTMSTYCRDSSMFDIASLSV